VFVTTSFVKSPVEEVIVFFEKKKLYSKKSLKEC